MISLFFPIAKALFRSAPTAKIPSTCKSERIGSGTYPRERRIILLFPEMTCVTESSSRLYISLLYSINPLFVQICIWLHYFV